MKKLKKFVSLLLVFVMCSCACAFGSQTTGAIEEIRIKSGTGLEIVEYGQVKILKGLSEKKTLGNLLSMFYANGVVSASFKGKALGNEDIVSTGTTVSCGDYSFFVVIKGDTTGDGIVNASDFMQIKQFFLEGFELSECYYLAADTNEDGQISTSDYLQIRNYFLKGFDLFPNDNLENIPSFLEVIINGQSEYRICYGSDSEKVAAYTLQELLSSKTGVNLSVATSSNLSAEYNAICLEVVDESVVGNYGYSIQTGENQIIIYASSLSGFDKAFAKLTAECIFGNTFVVSSDYFKNEGLNWQENYVLSGDDYNSVYNSEIFYNDKNDSVAYVSNAMWHMFGAVDDGQNLVPRFGNEPTWYEWNSEKIAWNGNAQYMADLKRRIRNFPQTSTGYMWSWGAFPYWKVDNCYSIHYDGTFRYISAVYDIISWEGNTDFLSLKDLDSVTGDYASKDSSRGKTVLQKTEACMNYILEYLHGNEGYILLTEESTYLDSTGANRFDYVIDENINCWNNTGKNDSAASNYWDNLCFGNYDGYSNALFYNSLQSMAKIYRMLGGTYISKAENLEALAVKVKEKFNELYWDEEKGRYIACVDSDGHPVDYGLTFHNFEILKYGLADEEKAKSIFDWVDGERIIYGENRVGTDIFSYARIMQPVIGAKISEITSLGLRLAAVTNTVAINNAQNKPSAWWHGPAGIDVWTSASYGKHLENGGYIFYPVFYELMARTVYENAQSTTDRLFDIGKVFEYNRLKSDAAAAGSTYWLEGLIGEYPESGLVPTTYLYSLVGLNAEYDGLHLSPAFNDVYEYMGINSFKYGGKTYKVQVNRDSSCVITPASGSASINLHYSPNRFKACNYTMRITKTGGSVTTSTLTPDANGVIHAKISGTRIAKVEIVPVLG